MRRRHARLGASLALIGAILAGCSGGPGTSPTASTPAASSGASTAAGSPSAAPASPLPGTKTFSVGITSPGLATAGWLAALEAMRGQGYTIDAPIIENAELVTQGVASGQFAFGSAGNNNVLTAIEAGANLKVIMARVNNEWTMYAKNSIVTCADLTGHKLAIHSEGGVSTAMVKNYVATNCPGTTPEYIILPGSDVRVKALLANQIEASPLELGDALTIDAQASDRYHQLSNFSADLPNLQTSSIYVNGDWAKANPGTVIAMVKAVLEQNRKIDGNPAYLQQICEQFVPDTINKDTIAAAAKKYTDLDMFPVNGGVTKENLDYTAVFFGPDGTKAAKTVFTLEQWADLSYLDAALAELGKK
jgi:ABC-type nitrate/sulfonate/bicarbonate transport system substrate-binding protein